MAHLRFAGAAALLGLLAACAEPSSNTRFPAPTLSGQAAPAPAPAPAVAPNAPHGSERAFVVFFEEWSAALSEPAQAGLNRVAQMALAEPRVGVLVLGFTGPRGSEEANALLARLRARQVADSLIEKGIAASRIRVLSRGPIPGFESLESRRVEVRIDDGRR
jgi:outer membrane protein OmpA-like peptidoglycan-associated protein